MNCSFCAIVFLSPVSDSLKSYSSLISHRETVMAFLFTCLNKKGLESICCRHRGEALRKIDGGLPFLHRSEHDIRNQRGP